MVLRGGRRVNRSLYRSFKEDITRLDSGRWLKKGDRKGRESWRGGRKVTQTLSKVDCPEKGHELVSEFTGKAVVISHRGFHHSTGSLRNAELTRRAPSQSQITHTLGLRRIELPSVEYRLAKRILKMMSLKYHVFGRKGLSSEERKKRRDMQQQVSAVCLQVNSTKWRLWWRKICVKGGFYQQNRRWSNS